MRTSAHYAGFFSIASILLSFCQLSRSHPIEPSSSTPTPDSPNHEDSLSSSFTSVVVLTHLLERREDASTPPSPPSPTSSTSMNLPLPLGAVIGIAVGGLVLLGLLLGLALFALDKKRGRIRALESRLTSSSSSPHGGERERKGGRRQQRGASALPHAWRGDWSRDWSRRGSSGRGLGYHVHVKGNATPTASVFGFHFGSSSPNVHSPGGGGGGGGGGGKGEAARQSVASTTL